MKTASQINAGDQVQGSYYGVRFSGVVMVSRPHFDHRLTVLHIDLKSPISLFGESRNDVTLTVEEDGVQYARNEVTGSVKAN